MRANQGEKNGVCWFFVFFFYFNLLMLKLVTGRIPVKQWGTKDSHCKLEISTST